LPLIPIASTPDVPRRTPITDSGTHEPFVTLLTRLLAIVELVKGQVHIGPMLAGQLIRRKLLIFIDRYHKI
jgi:hypothetical protein